jgi:hypothetical protein
MKCHTFLILLAFLHQFLRMICIKTNKHADQSLAISTTAKEYSRFQAWKPVTEDDMRKFLGL